LTIYTIVLKNRALMYNIYEFPMIEDLRYHL
jgi:hypothetical protein